MTAQATVPELVQRLYAKESAKRRGPCFVAVALALEQQAQFEPLTAVGLIQLFGRPDRWHYKGGDGLFIYFFDHCKRGRNRDEWFFHIQHGEVRQSGYNPRGVND